ncbi:MAG: cupin domain-containing protein [bacterium]
MKITPTGSTASAKGPADWFTGTVRMDHSFAAEAPARVRGATVTFEPGARTNWHTHPLGQTLIILSGQGRVQSEGGKVQIVNPGDQVWFAPDERHWHGAGPTTAMTHLALHEALDGNTVTWAEPVSDADYAA